MTAPLSPAHRRVLEAGLIRQKALGGAVTLKELSGETHTACSTLHKHVRTLVTLGVAKKSEHGPGFVFRVPPSDMAVRLFNTCKELGLTKVQTNAILKAGEGW